jgi:PKD repeat protein
VIACSAPVATFSLPATACSNYSFTTGNTSTGAPAPSYFWSVSPSTNVTITPSPVASAPGIQIGTPGIYSITLLVSNASGTAQTTQTLNVTPCAPIAAFSIPEAVCFTDPIITFSTTNSTSHPAGASGSLSYTWSIVPNNGLSFSPNLFQPNVKVTITNTTISQYTVTLRARNASGTSTVTQVIMASECTGIEEEGSLAQQVSLFPNPAHNQVHITLPVSNDTYSVKLTNLLGSVIFEEKSIVGSTEKVSVNIANQPKGVYFLTVENKNEKVTKKFIVE